MALAEKDGPKKTALKKARVIKKIGLLSENF